MEGFDAIDGMDLSDDPAHQSACSIYPIQRSRPPNPVFLNRLPIASIVPSDLSQYETEWSLSSVTAKSSHDHSASSDSQQNYLLSALAAEAQQLWESVGSPPCHPAVIAPIDASAFLMPALAGNFGAATGVDFIVQPKQISAFPDPGVSQGEHFGPAYSAAAVAVRRRRSINDVMEAAAQAAAASAFYGLSSSIGDANLEEFSLGPGFPRCPP
jgi:hypothetical protein